MNLFFSTGPPDKGVVGQGSRMPNHIKILFWVGVFSWRVLVVAQELESIKPP